jgi:hypothetical protein
MRYREEKVNKTLLRSPQNPLWKGGHPAIAWCSDLERENVCVGSSLCPAQQATSGLQLNVPIMAFSSLQQPTGVTARDIFCQPRGSGAALECFWIGKSGLVIFYQPSQSSVLMGPKFSICTGSRIPLIGSDNPFQTSWRLSTKSTFKCEPGLESSRI